ncbi:hypothetical protein BCR42DRAFT_178511 [Absidia repens]|uniref:Uncharacterized protein n=1 Tax=Absidia repens TaxID=90262 RepID=A0A1X2HZ67_9FUNG|nr:hypothetical protein BCR42DRAFT_178511 [Absidia repens]
MYRKRQQRQQFQLETMDPRAANAFNGYDALQKPTLEDDDEDHGNQPAYRMSSTSTPTGPQSDQSTSTMVTPQTVSTAAAAASASPFKVKPSDDIITTMAHDGPPGIEPPPTTTVFPPHTFSYEVADRNDSHTSIKPHDAKIE